MNDKTLPKKINLCRMYKEILIEATKAGANELQKYFNGKFSISHKEGINNLVTEADFASDKAIRSVIKTAFPDHGIVSEEADAKISESDYRWIIDPIDGTVNFANGIPICCVSIGLEFKREMFMGAVYNPNLNEFFFAEKGKGAFLNDEKISVGNKTEVSTSCLVTGFPYNYLDQPNGPLEVFAKLIKRGIPVRRLGSAAIDLCWVAAGRFDGFYEHELHAWDSAAGFLMVEEAGGKVTNLKGEKYNPFQPGIIATNGKIHDELQKIIAGEKW
jgi:myo-inositol-1(or 4)-monophosphatase